MFGKPQASPEVSLTAMAVGVCSRECEVLDGVGRVDSRPEKTQQGSRGIQQAIESALWLALPMYAQPGRVRVLAVSKCPLRASHGSGQHPLPSAFYLTAPPHPPNVRGPLEEPIRSGVSVV